MITTKEAKRRMMESMFIAAPKPYIVASYEASPRKKRKRISTDRGRLEAELFESAVDTIGISEYLNPE